FIPGQKLRTLALKSFDRSEVSLTPEALCPEMMDSFDERMSLRCARRNEDQLDAQGEGQTNKTPENTRGSAQAGEGRVVVDLQEVRHSHTSAGLQEMAAHRGSGLVSAAGLRQSMSVSVNGVKDEDLLPAIEVASRTVTGEKGEGAPGGGSGIEGGLGLGVAAGNKSCGFERAIDGGERRNSPGETMGAKFFRDGAPAAQSNFSAVQSFAQAQDK